MCLTARFNDDRPDCAASQFSVRIPLALLEFLMTLIRLSNCRNPAHNPGAMDTPPLLTPRDVAEYLKVRPATVVMWARYGTLPGIRIGSRWRFVQHDIDKMLSDALAQARRVSIAVRTVGPYPLGPSPFVKKIAERMRLKQLEKDRQK